jgi:hypothetical protein
MTIEAAAAADVRWNACDVRRRVRHSEYENTTRKPKGGHREGHEGDHAHRQPGRRNHTSNAAPPAANGSNTRPVTPSSYLVIP